MSQKKPQLAHLATCLQSKALPKKKEDEGIKIKQEKPKFKILDTIGDLWPRQTVMHGAVYGVKWGGRNPKESR